MVANLLARQYGVIKTILVDVPACQINPVTFLLDPDGDDLRSNLLHLIATVGCDEITSTEASTDDHPDVEVLIGPCERSPGAEVSISVTADGWKFLCSTKDPAPTTVGESSNPIGPYMAACFAAASVFKYFFQTDHAIDLAYSLWNHKDGEWSDLSQGPEPKGELPRPFYLIGAGAVGTACAFTLAAAPNIQGTLIPIDPQTSDETSRNRLISCAYKRTNVPKVTLLESLFASSEIDVIPYQGFWPDYTADDDRRTPPEIREIELAYRYEWVLSCVDRNKDRRAIAKYLPKNVIGGSTNGGTAQIVYYVIESPFPCLACYHPVPAALPTAELREQLLAMTIEEKREWYVRHDADNEAIDAMELYLKDPDCGGPGEAKLTELGREGETDWSVGFVSVASGVTVAAEMIRIAMLGKENAINDQNEIFAWFWKPGVARSVSRKKKGCAICGDRESLKRYWRRWKA